MMQTLPLLYPDFATSVRKLSFLFSFSSAFLRILSVYRSLTIYQHMRTFSTPDSKHKEYKKERYL